MPVQFVYDTKCPVEELDSNTCSEIHFLHGKEGANCLSLWHKLVFTLWQKGNRADGGTGCQWSSLVSGPPSCEHCWKADGRSLFSAEQTPGLMGLKGGLEMVWGMGAAKDGKRRKARGPPEL